MIKQETDRGFQSRILDRQKDRENLTLPSGRSYPFSLGKKFEFPFLSCKITTNEDFVVPVKLFWFFRKLCCFVFTKGSSVLVFLRKFLGSVCFSRKIPFCFKCFQKKSFFSRFSQIVLKFLIEDTFVSRKTLINIKLVQKHNGTDWKNFTEIWDLSYSSQSVSASGQPWLNHTVSKSEMM